MSIKERFARNKTILANFSYLSILRLFTILFPLLTYPYLLRVIGLELYGVIVFAQTIAFYASLVIDFGFNMSSARAVAVYKTDKTKLSQIVSSTYICKFVIWCICLFLYIVTISVVPFFREHYWIYALSFLLTLNGLLFPAWFFQGIEKMKYITIVNLSARLLFVVTVFLVVREQDDYLWVPVLNGMGSVLAGVLSIYIVMEKEKIHLSIVSVTELKVAYRESAPLFVSNLSTQTYVNVNKLVVGFFLGMSDVSIYDMAEKTLQLLKLPIGMMGQAVFPKIARERNIRFVNRIMFVAVGIVTLSYMVMFVSCDYIVYLFSGEYIADASMIMRLLGTSAILVTFNECFGVDRLVPFGYSSAYMKVMMSNCLFFLLGIFLLWFIDSINLYTVTLMEVSVETFCLLLLVYRNKQLGLLFDRKTNRK